MNRQRSGRPLQLVPGTRHRQTGRKAACRGFTGAGAEIPGAQLQAAQRRTGAAAEALTGGSWYPGSCRRSGTRQRAFLFTGRQRPQSLAGLAFSFPFSCFYDIINARGGTASRGIKSAKDAERKGQTMTDAAKEARRQYKRQWAKNNPEKVKAQQDRYWAKRAAAQAEQEQEPEEREGAQCKMQF